MSTRKALGIAAALTLLAGVALAGQGPGLGKPIAESDIKAWDIGILPDGSGLPPGSGTPQQGAVLYSQQCIACHGPGGKGGKNNPLVGGEPLDSDIAVVKTVGNFWGYSTTLFDYNRRAMPWPSPRTLTNDQVYALAAYILALNKIIGEEDVMNAETLPKVKMPNRDNFIIKFPDRL